MEDILKAAICCIPYFDTSRVRCDKSVEDGVVEDAEASVFVCQVMVDRLIVVVEDQAATSDNDPLGGLSNRQSVDLIQAAVKRLSGRISPHVPDTDHA